MKSNILRSLRSIAIMTIFPALAAGCSDDVSPFVPEEKPESGYITLSLNCVTGTRAEDNYTEVGKEALHENLISDVTICLWGKSGDNENGKPDYMQTFTNVDKELTASLRIPLTPALKKKLFETEPGECNAFVAVNVAPPTEEELKNGFTVEDFRKMAIGSEFSQHRRQQSFAMDGDCVVKYDKDTNSASGSVDLQRSASKISLALNVDEIVEQSVVVDGKLVNSTWRPDTKSMRVFLMGGLEESTLDPDLESKPAQGAFFDTASDKIYEFVENKEGANGAPDNGNNPNGKEYPFLQDIPFYTYPHRWSAEPGDYATTYMTLSIPWQQVKEKKDDAGSVVKDEHGNVVYEPVENASWRTCYYQVPVIAADSDLLQLVRNVAYHVYLHVGLLGSFIPDEPLLLEDLEYSAAEWGTVNMDVNIPDVRYLVVDQNDYTVNNETSITIPFYTSHETIVTDATMTFYRYNYDDVGRELPVVVTMAKNEESAKSDRAGEPVFTADFNNETKELTVTHDLVMYEGLTSGGVVVSYTNNDGPTVTTPRKPMTRAEWDSEMNKIRWFRKMQPTTAITDVTEYSRVEYEITVQHKDMRNTPNFKEVIKITQYPGMYITTVPNYCPTTSTTFDYSGAEGNTIINGCYTGLPESLSGYLCGDDPGLATRTNIYQEIYSTQYYGWCTSIGLESGNLNFNPNMYLVTVTSLSTEQGEKYAIGDPRSKVINNYLEDSNSSGSNNPLPTGQNLEAWGADGKITTYKYKRYGSELTSTAKGFVKATALDANGNTETQQRTLKYYYPTLETPATKMMIAPKFRICSSYAGTSWILNRELARRRAAAYQEMGYPAGRWRLPTYGEVSFIMDLAAQYKIPRLFGTGTTTWYYWCAHGLVTVPAKEVEKGPSLPITASGYDESVIMANGGNATIAPVAQRARFVYDEWYWGDKTLQASGTSGSTTPVYTFTWGDREINFGTEL